MASPESRPGDMPTLTRRQSLTHIAAPLTLTAPLLSRFQTTPGETDPTIRSSNVRAFGALGDRRALDDEAFRHAIAAATATDQYPNAVFVPAGNYRRSRPIALPNLIALRGDGPSSILNSQNDGAFDAPILTNAEAGGAVGWRLSDLSLYGGSHGLKLDVTGEIANLRFDDVGMLLQSKANIEANRLFQTTKFFGGVLGSAPYGLKVNGWTTNAFNSFGLEWTDHSEASLYLRGAECVLVVGGRFEGSGKTGKATIDIEDGASITFMGVYFENVHEYLARLRRVQVASFVNCHFTGTTAGSASKFVPFKWDIDANLLVFRDCHSSLPMPVPGNVVLDGVNANIFPTHAVHTLHGLHGSICAAPRPLAASGTIDILEAGPAPGSDTSDGVFHADLTLTTALPGTAAPIMHWSGTIAITLQDGAHLSISSPSEIHLGTVAIQLVVSGTTRLQANYRVHGAERGAIPQLSWVIDWRRVAGGSLGSVVLSVP